MSEEDGVPLEAVVLTEVEAGFKNIETLYTTDFNEDSARSFLSKNNWPIGLQDLFVENLKQVPIRFFICDDSGSMSANDSRKVVVANGNK